MTTISLAEFNLSPKIVVSASDHSVLIGLAMAGAGDPGDEANGLMQELERAVVVPDAKLPADAVRMGSRVRYRTNGGAEREVTLVYPKDADIGEGRISVLTPVGTALVGLRVGQSITWETRNGRKQVMTVLAATPPADENDDPGPRAA